MFITTKVFLVIVSLTIVLGYPQPLPAEEEQLEKEVGEEIPKIFNTPGEIEVQPNGEPILAEDAKQVLKKDVLVRPDRSAAYTYYYPGVYYYPPKLRWNPYYYYNYYYWWL